jgi:cysteinyl-tRNA synthetase
VIRHFILTSHYRTPLDFSNEALKAAESGSYKLREAVRELGRAARGKSDEATKRRSDEGAVAAASLAKSDAVRTFLADIDKRFADAMNEDFNTAAAMATVFELARQAGVWVREAAPAEDLLAADMLMQRLTGDALGLKWQDTLGGAAAEAERNALIQILVDLRNESRKAKNYAVSDQVRQRLTAIGVELKDGPGGTTW